MVYRKPEGADRQIKGIRYVDVRPGQTEVRIEMPDAERPASRDRVSSIHYRYERTSP